jgi:alanine racemase
MFMVKSNAYGHGMVPIVRFAVQKLGIRQFGCASVAEGVHLREALPDLEFDIFVFSDLGLDLKNAVENYVHRRMIPAIASLHDLSFILKQREFAFVPLCLKFNTGMNRLGIHVRDVSAVINLLNQHGRKKVHHMLSHFACSFLPITEDSLTMKQYNTFQQIKRQFRDAGIVIEQTSLANSGAIEQAFALDETTIRPGLILYGPSSLSPEEKNRGLWHGENISSMETCIISVEKVKKGDQVGYGAIPCPHDGMMAFVAIGYGDGFSTRFSGVHLSHKGFDGAFFGRINMDLSAVLFPSSAEPALIPGEKFLIWDRDTAKFLTMAEEMKTIPYELFCQISVRVPRYYSLD